MKLSDRSLSCLVGIALWNSLLSRIPISAR